MVSLTLAKAVVLSLNFLVPQSLQAFVCHLVILLARVFLALSIVPAHPFLVLSVSQAPHLVPLPLPAMTSH